MYRYKKNNDRKMSFGIMQKSMINIVSNRLK